MVEVMHAALGKSPTYMVNDLSEIRPPDGKTRKLLSTYLGEHDVVALVNIGANPIIRAISALVGGATRLLHNRPHPVHFVATLEEARALVATLRAQREASTGK
jgi:hypothetical protein